MIIDHQKLEFTVALDKYPNLTLSTLELWVRHTIEAGNEGLLAHLIADPWANRITNGFDWVRSPLGSDPWFSMLITGAPTKYRLIEQLDMYLDFKHWN
jgi:hypothetical protein